MAPSRSATRSGTFSSRDTPIKDDPDSPSTGTTAPTEAPQMIDMPTPWSNQANAMSSIAGSLVAPTFYRSDAPTPSLGKVHEDRTEAGTEAEVQLMQIRPMQLPTPTTPSASQHLGEDQFTTSFRDIGVKLKACNDTLGELHQLGVSHVVSLPALVLVGDQSSGKSSLLSGLADIELPRSEGQCTRCPIHIRLSRNGQWSCRVWLQRDWRYRPANGQPITERMVTNQDRFPPWKKCEREQIDFKTIYKPGDIDSVLRWAQIAVLDDRDDVRSYMPSDDGIVSGISLDAAARNAKAKFSPNVVSLDISGPDLPDLSFFDMPGIFQSAEKDEDQYLTKVVQHLTREYVSNKDAIIMCAMPMNQDADNSCTFNILRQVNATNRTIGVLTKADLLPKSDPERWLRILNGEIYGAGLGYFVTSRPTNRPLDELKRWEDNFFEPNTNYELDWPTAFYQHRDRCSVERLKLFLSKKLGEEFARRLPDIKHKVIRRLTDVNEEIKKLPDLPANVEHEVKMGLRRFEDIARERLRGNDFNSVYKTVPKAFLDTLKLMKPTFILKHDSDNPVIEIESSDDESTVRTPVTTPSSKRPHHAAATGQQPVAQASKRRQGPNGVVAVSIPTVTKQELREESVTPSRRGRGQGGRGRGALPQPFNEIIYRRSTYKLHDLRMMIAQEATVPNVINSVVYERLCTDVVREWQKPMHAFLLVTVDLIEDAVIGGKHLIHGKSALEQAMGGFRSRLIYRESQKMLQALFLEKCEQMSHFLNMQYGLEIQYPFTVNDAEMKRHQNEQGEALRAYRHHMRWIAYNVNNPNDGTAEGDFIPPAQMQDDVRRKYESVRAQQVARMGPDRFAQELDVASYVRGYYMHAAQRFGDAVALAINNKLLPELSRGLGDFLEEKLTYGRPSGVFSRLMEEDVETARRRESLKNDRERFQKALDSIRQLEAQEGSVAAAEGGRLVDNVYDGLEEENSVMMEGEV